MVMENGLISLLGSVSLASTLIITGVPPAVTAVSLTATGGHDTQLENGRFLRALTVFSYPSFAIANNINITGRCWCGPDIFKRFGSSRQKLPQLQ